MTKEQIDNWFTHHPPQDLTTINAYHAIREAGKHLALTILEHAPAGADQAAAIIADLKNRNDELKRALTAVQTVSTQQVEEIRQLKRGGYAGAEQE